MITYGLRCACVFAFRVAAFSFGPNFGQFYDAVFTSKPFCHVVLLNEVAAALWLFIYFYISSYKYMSNTWILRLISSSIYWRRCWLISHCIYQTIYWRISHCKYINKHFNLDQALQNSSKVEGTGPPSVVGIAISSLAQFSSIPNFCEANDGQFWFSSFWQECQFAHSNLSYAGWYHLQNCLVHLSQPHELSQVLHVQFLARWRRASPIYSLLFRTNLSSSPIWVSSGQVPVVDGSICVSSMGSTISWAH